MPDEHDQWVIDQVFIYVVGLAGGVVNLLGLVGNTLSFVTLTRPELRSSNSSLYLITLSVYDNIYLFLDLLVASLDWIVYWADPYSLFNLEFTAPASVVLDPIIAIFISGSFYVTIALSIDRCIAVVKPLQWSAFCTRNKIKLALVVVSLWSVLINAPLFAELKLENVRLKSLNKTYLVPRETEYSQTDFHQDVYLKFIVPAVTMVIPVTCILVSNAVIVAKMKFARRDSITSSQTRNTRAKEANRLTAQVLFISILTLISRILHAVSYILLSMENTTFVTLCSLPCACVTAISVFFFKVNAATNFICYCYFGKRFRALFLATFPCLRCRKKTTTLKSSAIQGRQPSHIHVISNSKYEAPSQSFSNTTSSTKTGASSPRLNGFSSMNTMSTSD